MSVVNWGPLPWSGRRVLLVALIGGMLLLSVGVFIGLRSPWGTKHPMVADGIAMRANDENDLVLFNADDGTQLAFGADHIPWEAERLGGRRG